MKVAILVYGMYREFDIAVKSWSFLNDIDNDVYFSTWDRSLQRNKKLNITVDEEVTTDRIHQYIPTATINLESDILPLSNPQKMIYHWKQCLRMMKESNKKYDLIMLTRPDTFKVITNYESIYKCNVPNVLYGLEKLQHTKNGPFIQDVFFLGTNQTISHLIDTIPSNISSIHNGLANHILTLGYDVEVVEGVYVSTVRSNSRSLKSDELTLSNIFAKTVEWGNNQDQYFDFI